MIAGIRFLAEQLWPALAGGIALGVLVGVASCAEGGGRVAGRLAAVLLLLLLGGGVAASLLYIAPGRLGLWLDMGVLLLGAYLIGCMLGCVIRKLWRMARGGGEAAAGA